MKKIIFSVILLLTVGFSIAKPTAPKCATAQTNTGVCYATYDENGNQNGSNCTDPGAGSTAVKNCVYN